MVRAECDFEVACVHVVIVERANVYPAQSYTGKGKRAKCRIDVISQMTWMRQKETNNVATSKNRTRLTLRGAADISTNSPVSPVHAKVQQVGLPHSISLAGHTRRRCKSCTPLATWCEQVLVVAEAVISLLWIDPYPSSPRPHA